MNKSQRAALGLLAIERSMAARNALSLAMLTLIALTATGACAEPQTKKPQQSSNVEAGALAGHRCRVVVLTDIGGTDPDDFQSMVYLLVYADCFDIEGLISSPYGPGRKEHILKVIDCYEKDFEKLRTYSEKYPTAEVLRAVTKQGETDVAPYAGVRRTTEGSRWLVNCAKRDDPRPLFVLVWGGLEDLAQALHDAPEILPKLRVYWIGGPNKKWSPDAYQYIATHYPTLWIIESNATYRGWFTGGDQRGQWGNESFVKQHVAGNGALGEFFNSQLGGKMKMGDAPSVAWLLQGTSSDPSQPGWGGRFVKASQRPYALFDRLTTTDDHVEMFSIVEFALPLGTGAPAIPKAQLVVENQSLAGYAAGDGTIRFRFCPNAAKVYNFKIRSNVPSLDTKTFGITADAPKPESAKQPDKRLPNWWTDDPAPGLAESGHIGAKTVSQWRQDYLQSFAERMARCKKPNASKN